MRTYAFVFDNGTIVLIDAKSRQEAIKVYCETRGMPRDFLQRHCKVKLMGRRAKSFERRQINI